MRKKERLLYPGACSLEFQNIMQIVIETLFNWDTTNQEAKGPGIFGTVVAFAPADEEQGRKTLHRHIQLWVKEFDQKLRKELFSDNKVDRDEARAKFQDYVDMIMSTTFGPDLYVPPINFSNAVCTDASPQIFRDARHKELCKGIEGKVIQRGDEKDRISPMVLIEYSLKQWKKHALRDAKRTDRFDTALPMDSARVDIAAYCYSYHMIGGSNRIDDEFWGDEKIRQTLLRYKFDMHEYGHRCSCFKKTSECRFLFPFLTTSKTYIHEDLGLNDKNIISWHDLDLKGNLRKMAPWMVIPKRPMGCQYINAHNPTLSEIFNCNTNVQVGDPFHMYYITLYNLKSTQEEDSERNRRITQTIVRRLIRIQDEVRVGERDETDNEPDFVEGLCRMLGGMHAATSRYVVSSTMAHLLICQDGTRFKFSHGFSDLLVGQLEASLEGLPVDFRLRVNRHNKKKTVWKDSLADDYLHRPEKSYTEVNFENMCFYEMTRQYKKKFLTFKQMEKLEQRSSKLDSEGDEDDIFSTLQNETTNKKYPFKQSHPGFNFCHLAKLNLHVIPKISLPGGKLCDIRLLKLTDLDVDETTNEYREYYAKMALLMFYPFRTLDDLKIDGSYWTKFRHELEEYSKDSISTERSQEQKAHTEEDDRRYKFWPRGFVILQNFQDRLTLEKELKRARDPILLKTACKLQEQTEKNIEKEGGPSVPDITEFLSDFS